MPKILQGIQTCLADAVLFDYNRAFVGIQRQNRRFLRCIDMNPGVKETPRDFDWRSPAFLLDSGGLGLIAIQNQTHPAVDREILSMFPLEAILCRHVHIDGSYDPRRSRKATTNTFEPIISSRHSLERDNKPAAWLPFHRSGPDFEASLWEPVCPGARKEPEQRLTQRNE